MNRINISIDDISPHPQSTTKVLEQCYRLIKIYPNIKFTLFIPIAYWRTIGITSSLIPYFIWDNSDFCDLLRNLSDTNFELGYHGYFHGIPNKSNNDEFQYLSENDSDKKIELMINGLKKSNLYDKFKKIFRPPAWRMSPEAITSFRKNNFEILALSSQAYALDTYNNENYNFHKVNYYNLNPPFIPLKILPEMNIVYHACEWDKNYLDNDKTEELIEFLKNIENKEFVFM